MQKPLFGMLLGGVLGVFDGLTALVSAPELSAQIASIVIGSTFKGLLAGVIIGWFARRVHSVRLGVLFGLAVSGLFAYGVAAMNAAAGQFYYWEIVLPGSVLGVIVGYATQVWSEAKAKQAVA